MVSKAADFLFMPSMIWVPFGLRTRADIMFPLQPVFEKKGVHFVHDEAVLLDLPEKRVETKQGQKLEYDYLVIATGPKLNYAAIPGFTPRKATFSPSSDRRRRARQGRLRRVPGEPRPCRHRRRARHWLFPAPPTNSCSTLRTS
ncbi:MAG: hypothetical protein IPG72_16130 [Ardenticatenales bacterium]|nr:hypothetical protein [Ardenticatenales bacterium]